MIAHVAKCFNSYSPGSSILLLQRAEIDTSLKDLEGYTAFDLYNATVEGTKPPAVVRPLGDLFTWGANRYALFV
jgi:inhibitor of Bruton tyrosine kinase